MTSNSKGHNHAIDKMDQECPLLTSLTVFEAFQKCLTGVKRKFKLSVMFKCTSNTVCGYGILKNKAKLKLR